MKVKEMTECQKRYLRDISSLEGETMTAGELLQFLRERPLYDETDCIDSVDESFDYASDEYDDSVCEILSSVFVDLDLQDDEPYIDVTGKHCYFQGMQLYDIFIDCPNTEEGYYPNDNDFVTVSDVSVWVPEEFWSE